MRRLIPIILLFMVLAGCSGGGSSANNSATSTSQNVPSDVVLVKNSDNSITVSWQAPVSSPGVLTQYNVYRDGNLVTTVSSAASTISYTDVNLSFGRSYSYAVSAIMANGAESPLSTTSITSIPIPPPSNLTALNTTLFSFKFSWDAPAGFASTVTSYKIFRDGILVAINAPTDTIYNDETLTPSTTYTYTVVASASTGDTFASLPLTAVTLSPGSTIASPVRGVILDPSTGSPIAGATVRCTIQSTGALAAQTTTDGSGQFVFSGLILGMTYSLDFTAAGYDTSVHYYNVIPYIDNSLPSASPYFLQPVRLVQAALVNQTSALTGFVKNATNNTGLANMSVKIRSGISNQTGAVLVSATTDSTGLFTFPSLPLGSYTAEVTGAINGITIVKTFATLLNFSSYRNADIAVSLPVFSANGAPQYRVILSWASQPSDLDSHMTGPTSSAAERFHVYYPAANRTWPLSSTGTLREVFLDVDNTIHGTTATSNNGPETTTILLPRVGTYNFYVHHFAGIGNITSSAASVRLYKGNQLLQTFYAPLGASGVSDVWSVFSMDVIDIHTETITTLGTLSKISTSTLP